MKTTHATVLTLLLFTITWTANAGVVSEKVTYKDGKTTLNGHLYYDDSIKGKRPGVLVIHEWWGLNDYARQRAKQLAEMGYVAFAADMYGDGKVTTHPKEAKAWMTEITSNLDGWVSRANMALALLRKNSRVDSSKTAAIGYCFGGATVVQMAYSGADVNGVVSFHGSLPPASADQVKNIKSSIMVAHGDADGFVPPEKVAAFKSALAGSNVDWQFISYGGARHAFTNPGAGEYGIENLKYDAKADKRSWQAMQNFFAEIF